MNNIDINKYLNTFNLFILFILTTILGNSVILLNFPNRIVSPDLVFSMTSYSLEMEYLADLLFFIGIFMFLFQYFLPEVKKRKDMINMMLIMYIARSIIMVFTPLMRPTGIDYPSHGFFRDYMTQLGMFPSGHVGIIALMYFMIQGEKYTKFKRLYLYVLILLSIFMVVSRGHYSIDVFGGVMLSYIVVNEYMRYINRSRKKAMLNSATN